MFNLSSIWGACRSNRGIKERALLVFHCRGGQTCHQRNIIIADIMQSAKKSGSSHGTLTGLIIQFPINNNSSHTLQNQQSQDYSHLNMADNDNNDEGMGNLLVAPSVEVDAYGNDREGMRGEMLAPLKRIFDHPLIEKIMLMMVKVGRYLHGDVVFVLLIHEAL